MRVLSIDVGFRNCSICAIDLLSHSAVSNGEYPIKVLHWVNLNLGSPKDVLKCMSVFAEHLLAHSLLMVSVDKVLIESQEGGVTKNKKMQFGIAGICMSLLNADIEFTSPVTRYRYLENILLMGPVPVNYTKRKLYSVNCLRVILPLCQKELTDFDSVERAVSFKRDDLADSFLQALIYLCRTFKWVASTLLLELSASPKWSLLRTPVAQNAEERKKRPETV
jgi:hypothetical protein